MINTCMKIHEILEGRASVSGDSFEGPIEDEPFYKPYQAMLTKRRRKKLSKKKKKR